MTRALFFLSLAFGLAAGSMAHPHMRADQQAHIILGRKKTVVIFYIAPSVRDGQHIFGHADRNGDGILNRLEQSAFANPLLKQSSVTIDGKMVALKLTNVAFPDKRRMVAGRGIVKVRAEVVKGLSTNSRHKISFAVQDNRFARQWDIQPFFASEFKPAPAIISLTRVQNRNWIALEI